MRCEIFSLVAAYDLGADSETLEEIYGKEKIIQRPLDLRKIGINVDGLPEIGEVDESNWTTWLGEERYVLRLVKLV